MKEVKEEIRSLVRVDFHGNVHKQFRGPNAEKRFANEIQVLQTLADRECPNVPRLLEAQEKNLTIITTNCGAPDESLSESKAHALFLELEERYGVRHANPEPENVTYSKSLGRFCLIDFELAEILSTPEKAPLSSKSKGDIWRAHWVLHSRRGSKHIANDDAFLALSVNEERARLLEHAGEELLEPAHLVFAVSDGMGGRNAGDFASRLILNFIKKDATDLYKVIKSGDRGKRALELLTKSTHNGLLKLSSAEPMLNGCGATLTLAWILPNFLYWVHVGDSRLYLKDGGRVEQLTSDDCELWHRLKNGEISEYEYRTNPLKSRLSDVIGGGRHRVKPQSGCIKIDPGSRILLCTDGVMDGLWDRQIKERLDAKNEIRLIAEEMLERSCENDPKDDTTLIVAEFDVV